MDIKRIAICDDEQSQLDKIEEAVLNCSHWRNQISEISRFNTPAVLLNAIKNGAIFELIFLDIQMPNVNGLDLYDQILDITEVPVVFVSSHMENQPEVDNHYPAMLLGKPFTQAAFDNVIMAFLARRELLSVFSYSSSDGIYEIPLKDIYYFEADGHYIFVYTRRKGMGRIMLSKTTMSMIEKDYSEKGFFRCHKTYIINLRYYVAHNYNNVELRVEDGVKHIKLSRHNDTGNALKNAYLDFKMGGNYAF